jgi:hypothetical protein
MKMSPDGRYSVLTEYKKVIGQSYPGRRLYLADNQTKKRIPLKLTGGDNLVNRGVDICWSPKSDSLVVNDWFASNIANAFLYQMKDPQHPLDAQSQLQKLIISKSKLKQMNNYLHEYIFATKWKNETTVEIKVAEDCLDSDSRKRLLIEQFPLRACTTYYDWDTLHNLFKQTKQTTTVDVSGGT